MSILHYNNILRLPEGAPAKQALEIDLNYPAKHPEGLGKYHGLILSKETSKHMPT